MEEILEFKYSTPGTKKCPTCGEKRRAVVMQKKRTDCPFWCGYLKCPDPAGGMIIQKCRSLNPLKCSYSARPLLATYDCD